jgi:hypothetical protein
MACPVNGLDCFGRLFFLEVGWFDDEVTGLLLLFWLRLFLGLVAFVFVAVGDLMCELELDLDLDMDRDGLFVLLTAWSELLGAVRWFELLRTVSVDTDGLINA